jgi:hypothetical protein
MSSRGLLSFSIVVPLAAAGMVQPARGEFATSVQSFTQGTVGFADGVSTYNNSAAATGQPNRIAGASIGFPGAVTPFNPPFEQGEVVSVGTAGQITVELPSLVAVSGGGLLQVGIFTTAGLNDPTFSGQAESAAQTFAGQEYGADRTAIVEVADTLGNFKSLGRIVFTQPTQAFSNQTDPYMAPDTPVNSDFNKPFLGTLATFNGRNQSQISSILDGSAGGTWVNIPSAVAAQLTGVRFVRISDPMWQVVGTGALETSRTSNFDPDGPAGPQQPFTKPADVFVDGINVVPEPGGIALIALMGALCSRRSRQASQKA